MPEHNKKTNKHNIKQLIKKQTTMVNFKDSLKVWFLGTDGRFLPTDVDSPERFIPITSVTDGNF